VYAHYIHTMLTKRATHMLNHVIKDGTVKLSLAAMKKKLEDEQRKNFTDAFKSNFKTREEWDKVYETIPDTAKYQQTGLNPGKVERLYDTFDIAKIEGLDKEKYEALKDASADHLSSIAMEARLEAIRQSKTAAGEFFKTHQDEVDQLYKTLHAHGAMQIKEKVGDNEFRTVEAVHKCHHFCASCCEKQKACTDGTCKVAQKPSSG